MKEKRKERNEKETGKNEEKEENSVAKFKQTDKRERTPTQRSQCSSSMGFMDIFLCFNYSLNSLKVSYFYTMYIYHIHFPHPTTVSPTLSPSQHHASFLKYKSIHTFVKIKALLICLWLNQLLFVNEFVLLYHEPY